MPVRRACGASVGKTSAGAAADKNFQPAKDSIASPLCTLLNIRRDTSGVLHDTVQSFFNSVVAQLIVVIQIIETITLDAATVCIALSSLVVGQWRKGLKLQLMFQTFSINISCLLPLHSCIFPLALS